jgi:hypothetical protein
MSKEEIISEKEDLKIRYSKNELSISYKDNDICITKYLKNWGLIRNGCPWMCGYVENNSINIIDLFVDNFKDIEILEKIRTFREEYNIEE